MDSEKHPVMLDKLTVEYVGMDGYGLSQIKGS